MNRVFSRMVLLLAVPLAIYTQCTLVSATELEDILLVSHIRNLAQAGEHSQAIAVLEDEIRDGHKRTTEEKAALVREIAPLYLKSGRHREAGKAFAILADGVARIEGATAPALAKIHGQAATAFQQAGDLSRAIDHLRRQLTIDRRYQSCESTLLADHLKLLADLSARAGKKDEAERYRRLSIDPEVRCADPTFTTGLRGIVVEKDLGAVTPGSFTKVNLFYATDRARTGSSRVDDFYGGERGKLEYGTIDVTVPRTHKPGQVEAPSLVKIDWSENPDRHFVITKVETLAPGQAMAQMRAKLDERGSDEVLVFIHGYNVTFAEAAKRTAQIAYDLNFEGIPFLYSWPSKGDTFSYIADEAVVRLSGRRLMQVLDYLRQQSGARSIHIIAHSMGNRALTDALELIAMRQAGAGSDKPLFEQVLFTAPDVDAGLFAEMIERIRPIARRLTLYASAKDRALGTSRKLHGQPRAGEAGADILVAGALDTIDMSELGSDMLRHGYFASETSALADMLWLMWRNDVPKRRCGMVEGASGESDGHWRFDPGRCDGRVVLSALTLLRQKGSGALQHALLSMEKQGDDKARAEEWRAITEMISSLIRR